MYIFNFIKGYLRYLIFIIFLRLLSMSDMKYIYNFNFKDLKFYRIVPLLDQFFGEFVWYFC